DVLRRGSESLGYRLGVDYDLIPRNAHGCASRCDFCFFGCVYDAKQSSLVTYLPDAHRAGARFLFDTKADHLIIQGGEVRGVEATFHDNGHSIPMHVRARTVVAAGSAIQTPALLLRSGIRSPGAGLGLRLDPTIALVRDVAEGRVTIDARGEPLLEFRLSSRDRRNLTRGLQEAARIQRAAGALRVGSLHLRECSVGDGTGPIRDADFDAFIDR